MLNLESELLDGVVNIKQIISYLIITGSAFICSYFVYPTIIYLSHIKRLSQEPNERSSHVKKTPVLGGIGIFIGFIMSAAIGLFLLHQNLNLLNLIVVFFSCFALLVVGLKDDILPVKPLQKLAIQILVASFIVLITKNTINSPQGLFGVYELHNTVSICFTIFVFVIIINAFNLIDGIDGLAGLQSLISTGLFGIYFAVNNRITLTLLACSLAGALIAFLFFNLSNRRKIFMGDSGSIFVGLLIAYFSVAALKTSTVTPLYEFKNSAVLVMSVLCYPLVDTLRVFIIRICNKRSPFSPDRNHLHHILIDLGLRHRHASICISMFTIIITVISLSLNHLDINSHFIIMVSIVLACIITVSALKNYKKKSC